MTRHAHLRWNCLLVLLLLIAWTSLAREVTPRHRRIGRRHMDDDTTSVIGRQSYQQNQLRKNYNRDDRSIANNNDNNEEEKEESKDDHDSDDNNINDAMANIFLQYLWNSLINDAMKNINSDHSSPDNDETSTSLPSGPTRVTFNPVANSKTPNNYNSNNYNNRRKRLNEQQNTNNRFIRLPESGKIYNKISPEVEDVTKRNARNARYVQDDRKRRRRQNNDYVDPTKKNDDHGYTQSQSIPQNLADVFAFPDGNKEEFEEEHDDKSNDHGATIQDDNFDRVSQDNSGMRFSLLGDNGNTVNNSETNTESDNNNMMMQMYWQQFLNDQQRRAQNNGNGNGIQGFNMFGLPCDNQSETFNYSLQKHEEQKQEHKQNQKWGKQTKQQHTQKHEENTNSRRTQENKNIKKTEGKKSINITKSTQEQHGGGGKESFHQQLQQNTQKHIENMNNNNLGMKWLLYMLKLYCNQDGGTTSSNKHERQEEQHIQNQRWEQQTKNQQQIQKQENMNNHGTQGKKNIKIVNITKTIEQLIEEEEEVTEEGGGGGGREEEEEEQLTFWQQVKRDGRQLTQQEICNQGPPDYGDMFLLVPQNIGEMLNLNDHKEQPDDLRGKGRNRRSIPDNTDDIGVPSINTNQDMFVSSSNRGVHAKRIRRGSEDDDDKKTLSQQVKEGKYGLIQDEIYGNASPTRPGIISYSRNSEVPEDNADNFGGLNKNDIWLAENHLLVLKGGNFNDDVENESSSGHSTNRQQPVWPPIDNYQAPRRQVKIPIKPKVPPPFVVQLRDGGAYQIIGFNDTEDRVTGSTTDENQSRDDYQYDDDELPHTFYRNNDKKDEQQIPSSPRSPFFYGVTPVSASPSYDGIAGGDYVDDDDQSIYYPPPYSFTYKPDKPPAPVPPGPLVPGIILPPPPDFFSQLEEKQEKKTSPKKQTKPSTLRPYTRTTHKPSTTKSDRLRTTSKATTTKHAHTRKPHRYTSTAHKNQFHKKLSKPTSTTPLSNRRNTSRTPLTTLDNYSSTTPYTPRSASTTQRYPQKYTADEFKENFGGYSMPKQAESPSGYKYDRPQLSPNSSPTYDSISVRDQDQHIVDDQTPGFYGTIPSQPSTTPYSRPKQPTKPKPIYQYSFEATNYPKRIDSNFYHDSQVQQIQQVPRIQQIPQIHQVPQIPPSQYVNPSGTRYNYQPRQQGSNLFYNNQGSIYPSTTVQSIPNVTPNPQYEYFTKQDEKFLDNATKQYFTLFGKKLTGQNAPSTTGQNAPGTTPMYEKVTEQPHFDVNSYVSNHYDTAPQSVYEQRGYNDAQISPPDLKNDIRINYQGYRPLVNPDSEYVHVFNPNVQGQRYEQLQQITRPISLQDDTLVNYRHPRPPINPDAEFISPIAISRPNVQSGNSNAYYSYGLPGDGGHVYFLTPQRQEQIQQVDDTGYLYSKPAGPRFTRRRRNPKV